MLNFSTYIECPPTCVIATRASNNLSFISAIFIRNANPASIPTVIISVAFEGICRFTTQQGYQANENYELHRVLLFTDP